VQSISKDNFGPLIAFLLPGFVALWGVSYVSAPIRSWLAVSADDDPTVGGFLYVTLASVVAGITVSTIRWMLIDTIHHSTGVQRPAWDFSRLQDNAAAFDILNELYYRYYQFYANMVVAILFTLVLRHASSPLDLVQLDATDGAAVLLALMFFTGSRDSLQKYYRRTEAVMSQQSSRLGVKRSIDNDRKRNPIGRATASASPGLR